MLLLCVTLSSLPTGKLRRVVGSHATSHRCQEFLPLLLDQPRSADDLVTRRSQVRSVHFLSQILHHHLQISLVGEEIKQMAFNGIS